MAGSGVAVRLHEFKESQDTKHQPKHVVHRQGRDVLGLYPGQIARVHVVSSHLDRLTLKTPDLRCNEWGEKKNYQRRNFDLLALQASLQSSHRETQTPNAMNGPLGDEERSHPYQEENQNLSTERGQTMTKQIM